MDPNELTDEFEEQDRDCKTPEEHLEADSSGLSLDDLDSVAGGVRGRKKLQPRKHIGPDAKRRDD